jgi:hypothetical protein
MGGASHHSSAGTRLNPPPARGQALRVIVKWTLQLGREKELGLI